LRSKLADGEERLREVAASYELDPEIIDDNSLNDVIAIMKRLYLVLRGDAAAKNGVLAQMPDIWESLRNGYRQAFDATSAFRPMLERFKKIENEPRPAPGTLDAAAKRMVNARRDWQTKVADFQEALSAFYDELIVDEQRFD
jgi:hypothetical protein